MATLKSVTVLAPAKLNLALDVVGLLPNGYHNLDMTMQAITLFGSTSILTLTKSEVWLCIELSIIVVAVFMLFYNKIFAVTFDETFAQAVGTNAKYPRLSASYTAACG